MKCPECNCPNSTVLDTRDTRMQTYAPGEPKVFALRRRRVCHSCGHRWTTYETVGHYDDPAFKTRKPTYSDG